MKDRDEKDIKRDIGKGMSESGQSRERRPGQADHAPQRAAESNDPDQEWDRDRPTRTGDKRGSDDG